MKQYENQQISNVESEGWAGYKIKIASEDNQTNWMNITPSQLKKIKKIIVNG